jgi:sporulation protein YlmC with PRC-barrel domain
MFLAREVLDKEILDCNGFKGGKVDDLVVEMREGEAPVVKAIVTQQGALACHLGVTVARIDAWLREKVLGFGTDVKPVEIGWEHITRIDVTVHIDLDRTQANLMNSENAVWERWIRHLPFAQR